MAIRGLFRVLILCTSVSVPSLAQQAPPTKATGSDTTAQSSTANHDEQYERDKRYAIELYEQQNFVGALPWCEKLYAQDSKDLVIVELYAMATLGNAANAKDSEQAKAERIRARKLFEEAKVLGSSSNLVALALEQIPEDGSELPFSENQEVDQIMRAAEADFMNGRLDDALHGYIRALIIDPNLYKAALYAGDVYYKQKKHGSAGEWFARAIKIDPNMETAYRYWGDALLRMGKPAEAREKFIDAVVADPYSRASWMGLTQWAEGKGLKLTIPQIKSPNSIKTEGNATNITIDADSLKKKDGSSAWFGYEISRAAWRTEKYQKEKFPDGKYRHSLEEEAAALRMVAELARNESKKVTKLAPDLEILLRLDEQKLIEPYVLFHMADEEISRDYAKYRETNREKLREYLGTYVTPKIAE
jgi:tetratricopeptide (TPR) repeat protein